MKNKFWLYILAGLATASAAQAENFKCYAYCSDNQHHIIYTGAKDFSQASEKARRARFISSQGKNAQVLKVEECVTEYELFSSPSANLLWQQEPG